MSGTQRKARFGTRSAKAEGWPATASAGAPAELIVVGLGISSSGLEACRAFLGALPAAATLSVILIQQRDPPHDAISPEALAQHTSLKLLRPEDGMRLGPRELYIASPGSYLSVVDGALNYAPQPVDGAALAPFDLLLQSLAQTYGTRAVGVILGGSSTDGSKGALALKEAGGLVIAQDPAEAGNDDMPRNAIKTGAVDFVLPVRGIPAAIAAYSDSTLGVAATTSLWSPRHGSTYLAEIADLIHARVTEGFIRPQPAILRRVIQRRVAKQWPEASISRYLDILRDDAAELGQLAADIISATGRLSQHATPAGIAGQLAEGPALEDIGLADWFNVLGSMDAAVLLLDRQLRLRHLTPRAEALFDVHADQLGMPLSEIDALQPDDAFLSEARLTLLNADAIEREITRQNGTVFLRRISPYRRPNGSLAGMVVTFRDITQVKQDAAALDAAKRQAETAMATKSRLLAAASHDLRQPLQTLALLQGLLLKTINAPGAQELLALLDDTLTAMSGMLTTLLNINRIEAGAVQADVVTFPVNDLLIRLRNEFVYHARKPQHDLRVVFSSLHVSSDRQLLEQIIRNFLSNAVKYTPSGKILLGCRRHGEMLRIEVWDTGTGIPEDELDAIFEEYHQLNSKKNQADRGMGLGLAIVRRLSSLLRLRTGVRSRVGKGSVFFVEAPLAEPRILTPVASPMAPLPQAVALQNAGLRPPTVLVISAEADMRELLRLTLQHEGLQVMAFADGSRIGDLAAEGAQPDLVLADYRLPDGAHGLELAAEIRAWCGQGLPIAILAADEAGEVAAEIARHDCLLLEKPIRTAELKVMVRRLLPVPQAPSTDPSAREEEASIRPVIHIVDDDSVLRAGLRMALEEEGRNVEDYGSAEAFLAAYHPEPGACLLVDAYLPGMSGLDLLKRLRESGHSLPAIMITGNSDVPMAVQAMKTGAFDFIEKPVSRAELLASVDRALEQSKDANRLHAWRAKAAKSIASLSPRQRQIMAMVLAGQPSKIIAANLGISQRTVEGHRATIMKKTGCKSLPELARLALAAISNDPDMALTQYGFPKEILEQLSR